MKYAMSADESTRIFSLIFGYTAPFYPVYHFIDSICIMGYLLPFFIKFSVILQIFRVNIATQIFYPGYCWSAFTFGIHRILLRSCGG